MVLLCRKSDNFQWLSPVKEMKRFLMLQAWDDVTFFGCNRRNFWKRVNFVRYHFSHSEDDVEFKIISGRFLGGGKFVREWNSYAQKTYELSCNVSLPNFWLFFLLLFLDIGWPKCLFRNIDWTVIGYRLLANFILLCCLWIRERRHWKRRGGRKFIMNISSPSSLLHWQSNWHCQPHNIIY